MEVKLIDSACVLVRTPNGNVLCDPWLSPTAYYGSWGHTQPLDQLKVSEWLNQAGVDVIYISHIHPDHFDPNALRLLPKVPIVIPKQEGIPLGHMLRAQGHTVVELDHSEYHVQDGLQLTLFKPSGPELDSAVLIEDQDGYSCLNMNDIQVHDAWDIMSLPMAMAPTSMTVTPTFLLAGYAGAGPFPQCYHRQYGSLHMEELAARKQQTFLDNFYKMVKLVRPYITIPFAGDYTLVGERSWLNQWRGVPSKQEAFQDCEDESIYPLQPGESVDHHGEESLWPGGHQWPGFHPSGRYDYYGMHFPVPDYEKLEKTFQARLNRYGLDEVLDKWTIEVQPYGSGDIPPFKVGHGDQYHWFGLDPALWAGLCHRNYHWDNAMVGSHVDMTRDGEYDSSLVRAMSYLHL